MSKYLTNLEHQVLDFIEAYHTKYGEYPDRSVVEHVINRLGIDISPGELDTILENPLLLKSLEARGITPPTFERDSTTGLTKAQLAIIAVLNNSRDNRSDKKKLEDLGISTRQFSGWMHSKRFAEHMRDSAENILENSIADGHNALMRKVRAGDPTALKLFFEMTGRYNPAFENQVNLQVFMTRVIEIIQQNVKDPQSLQNIAAGLQLASVEFNINPTKVEKQNSTVRMAPKRREILF